MRFGRRGALRRALELVSSQCGYLRPHASAVGLVESDKNWRRNIAALPTIRREQLRTHPVGSQEITLRGQKRQLVGHVDPAEIGAKFDAVEDLNRLAEANMLWPQ